MNQPEMGAVAGHTNLKDTVTMEEVEDCSEDDYLEENQETDVTLQLSFKKPPLKKVKIDESYIESGSDKFNKPSETEEDDTLMEEFEDSEEEYEKRGFTKSGQYEKWLSYTKQIDESGGYDVEAIDPYPPCFGGGIIPLDMANLNGLHGVLLPGCTYYAISEENREKGTNLKLDRIIKANSCRGDCAIRYYVTFDAIDSCGIAKTYQTIVYYDAYFIPYEVEVVEFRKKPLNKFDGSKDLSTGIIGEPLSNKFTVFYDKNLHETKDKVHQAMVFDDSREDNEAGEDGERDFSNNEQYQDWCLAKQGSVDEFCEHAPFIGGIGYLDVDNLTGCDRVLVPGCTHYAIGLENAEKGINLKLERIVKAYSAYSCGVKYYVTFKAIDSCGVVKTYESQVFYNPFDDDCSYAKVYFFKEKPLRHLN
ncbi:hypothetical protein K2173_024751 [Erythroxylum novogranatense]|uniref:Cystatin domain-containing protein n=1 Tax=Erythroxylum novogranatense TaxID=1862640 RepID=A0AAV8SW97_9ROSI|nr:hypothetical protein K2173_024751 [Erythroxylum novogranatense]